VAALKEILIASEVRRLRERGEDIESVLAYLRKGGRSQMQSVLMLNSEYGMNLLDANRTMHESETWRDAREAMDAELDRLMTDEADPVDRAGNPER